MREACSLLLLASVCLGVSRIEEYQRYDGWFNNLANADWGSVGSRLHRDSPSNYHDGIYLLDPSLPSARAISDLVFKGPSGIPNKRNMTTMLAFFSQVVAYEMMHSTQVSCPLEMINIPVPKCDTVFDKDCQGRTEIPFVRAKYDKQTGHGFNSPREQVNERTSWIDASFLYSTQEPWVAFLRSWKNGTLEEGSVKGYPPLNNPHIPMINPPPPQIHRLMNPERLFILGDSRINENPGLLSFGLILYRWHNIQARRIQRENKDWTDEEVFQAARRWVIATLQKIVMYDFVPALLSDDNAIPPYKKYMPHVPPGISHAFATAAFRFPHSIVPPALLLRKRESKCEFRSEVGGFPALRLCQNWWNAQDIVQEYSVDEIVLGMASQIAEAEDSIVVEDLRDYIFGPMHFTRLDVVSSSIMRGRDNGVPPYNLLRRAFSLPARNWSTINPVLYAEKPDMFNQLAILYNNDISTLDAYVGGMLEGTGEGPGELFSAIIKDQFLRLRDSDRFWFENTLNGIFDEGELGAIRNITLRDIIQQTTSIDYADLQENIFFWKDGDPCPQPFQVNTSGLESCVPFMRFDHFRGNEVTYIFTLVGLAIIPLICLGIGYMLIQKRKKMGWDSAYDTYSTGAVTYEPDGKKFTMSAIEWLDEQYCRSVIISIEKEAVLRVRKPRGGLLRKISFPSNGVVNVTVSEPKSSSTHGPFCLISVERHHDLVIRMENDRECQKLLSEMGTILRTIDTVIDIKQASNDILLEGAQTKDRRQRTLDHFFREAYSQAFNRPELSDGTTLTNQEILQITLTKHEFADAIGMREDALFVERMFSVTAKGSETMSFQEFLQVILKFSNGTVNDRLSLVFAMCDRDGEGRVRKRELAEFLKSLNTAVGVNIDSCIQNDVIDQLLERSGVNPDNEHLNHEEFVNLFCNGEDVTRRSVGLDFRGARMKVNLEETESLRSFAVESKSIGCLSSNWIGTILSSLETYRQHIFILFVFFAINVIMFLERFWHYRYMTEHRDLRRVMGAGIAITRGAAASLSFDMAVILLTVCRNMITWLRKTVIGEYIPFDAAIAFHKIVALTAAFFALVHTLGHCVNFYHVATQSQEGLHCLFHEAVFGSNFLPSISYWFYATLTGITGILLVSVMSIIYVFALPAIMRRAYHAFRVTHLLNVALYALTFLHGLPKLLDSPKFFFFVIGPLCIFVIDRIMGMRQEYKKLQIITAALLPSDIIYLQFKRPLSFRFKSGQWVRISSPSFTCTFNESHAFSLASAPQATSLELYIKAVGPWTWQLRSEIIRSHSTGSPLPLLHLNGPYGDGNQDWHQYEVAVLIGGGIGVTPYASTLTDLVIDIASGRHNNIRCKKVYFLWICPTHKNYEWFVDVLKTVEELDEEKRILETHIFVTQFFHKFDVRTTMLYICEKHFRGEHSGVSMFTGLRAVNHFGRPNFNMFLKFVQTKHYKETSEIGVFSCGPASVNKQIRQACSKANRDRDAPSFVHRFETF